MGTPELFNCLGFFLQSLQVGDENTIVTAKKRCEVF